MFYGGGVGSGGDDGARPGGGDRPGADDRVAGHGGRGLRVPKTGGQDDAGKRLELFTGAASVRERKRMEDDVSVDDKRGGGRGRLPGGDDTGVYICFMFL